MDKKLTQIVKSLARAGIKTRPDLVKLKKRSANQQKINAPLNSDLLKIYHRLKKQKKIRPDEILERLLRKREIRTLSGVAVVTVLTKPYPCPGQCLYCPNEAGLPKSYLSNEPAARRAVLTKFDPYWQTKVRIDALKTNGHDTGKIELIVLGGTWSYYPKIYQAWFLKRCFDALNGKTAKTLAQAQQYNEKAARRCVGLTLETRPDYITESEIKRLRELGCTRVELGAQSIYDPILKLNKRGHNVNQIIEATRLLKTAGFKVMYHLMPNLPGSNPKKDLAMFKKIFTHPDFQPDLLKIYPCVVTKDSELYKWRKQKKFKPYSAKQLKDLLIKIKLALPPYVRLTRLIRDIPAESIVAGNKITNLRQIIQEELAAKGRRCKCIRCREAGHQGSSKLKAQSSKLFIQKYQASNGTEYFLSYESKDRRVLYAFLRLRINDKPDNFMPELQGAAIIRELHTFGEVASLGQAGQVQHLGLGKKLMLQAEAIAKKQGFKKIAVIAGIGVREYYKKLGYKLEGTYITKNISRG